MWWQDLHGLKHVCPCHLWRSDTFRFSVLHFSWHVKQVVRCLKKKKKHFWGSVSSKFVFPDWACVKFRQQRFLEHYDEAKPPWGSWAILLFKVWTGAAFICHCILHRSVCSSLCCFISLSFPHPLVMMMAQYMDVCSLRVHLPSPHFFSFMFSVSLSWKQGQRPKGCHSECLMLCRWKLYALLNAITGIIWFFMRVFEVEEISVSHCSKTHGWGV